MTLRLRFMLAASFAVATLSAPLGASAQQDVAIEPTPIAEAVAPTEAAEPAINEDEMADLLNSQQQIKQDVTLTRSVNGQVVETKTETVIYSKDDPLRETEAGPSPLEKLKAQSDSQLLTRKEAIEEARLDFVVADLDRNDAMNAAEFVFLVKGWEEAEIAGVGSGRFVEPFFHVDEKSAAEEHADLARAKFAAMAGEVGMVSRKKFTRMVLDEFERFDLDKDDLLRGDELLNFRAAVRGEPISPPAAEQSAE